MLLPYFEGNITGRTENNWCSIILEEAIKKSQGKIHYRFNNVIKKYMTNSNLRFLRVSWNEKYNLKSPSRHSLTFLLYFRPPSLHLKYTTFYHLKWEESKENWKQILQSENEIELAINNLHMFDSLDSVVDLDWEITRKSSQTVEKINSIGKELSICCSTWSTEAGL